MVHRWCTNLTSPWASHYKFPCIVYLTIHLIIVILIGREGWLKGETEMRHITTSIIILAMAVLFIACGSDSSGPADTRTGVQITCMDTTTSAAAECAGVPEASMKPGRYATAFVPVDEKTAVYNSGDIPTGVDTWEKTEVTNFMAVNASIYFYSEHYWNGAKTSVTSQSSRIDVLPGGIQNAGSGSTFCPEPGPCAYEGEWEFVTYVYNASHLPLWQPGDDYAVYGDPTVDELLYKGINRFTLTSGL